jgi:hypothetical protein
VRVSYGVDVAGDFETIVEATLNDDGMVSYRAVLLDKGASESSQ